MTTQFFLQRVDGTFFVRNTATREVVLETLDRAEAYQILHQRNGTWNGW